MISGCTAPVKSQNLLEIALSSPHPIIRMVMDSVNDHELQIIYTRIKRDKDSVRLTDFSFQLNDNNYFYPASTVKMPIAILAMEKLQQMDTINLYSRFYVEGDSIETTFAKEILKIFAVSDNAASNRLFEFLGQDSINKKLKDKHISPVRISHRLSTPNSMEVTTTPLIVYLNDSTTTPLPPSINQPPLPLSLNRIAKGKAFYEEEKLVSGPFNFDLKNYYPLSSQLQLLKQVIFPENFKKEEQFQLDNVDRDFLLKAMGILPKELGFDTDEYYDGYGKFLLYGDDRGEIPSHIKIYNKIGSAYGTLTDCAYIVDGKNGVEFMLAATILVNKNGVFNDNEYGYETIGLPFLGQLGREIYLLELQRK